MSQPAEPVCVESIVTWVRSGMWIGPGGVVPDAVLNAPPVQGLHQVHIDTAVVDQGAVAVILRDQSLDLLARMVHVPHGLAPGVAPAMTRADQVGLPTLAQVPESWVRHAPRLLPFDARGEANAVLVLPAEHLVNARYRRTEQWAIEQLGSFDPQAAHKASQQRDEPPSLRDWNPIGTHASPAAYLATLRERTAQLIELVRRYDASLTPPGRLRPEAYDPILAARLNTVSTMRTLVREVDQDRLSPTTDLPDRHTVVAAVKSYIASLQRAPQLASPSELLADLDPSRLAQVIGGDFSPLADVRLLFAALQRAPGTLAFVRFAASPTRLSGLIADGQAGHVLARWVVPGLSVARVHVAGLPETDASAGSSLNRQLTAPGTQVLLIDPSGNATTIAALLQSADPISGLGNDRTLAALLDPFVGPRRPGRWGARLRAAVSTLQTPIFPASLPAPGRPQLSADPPTAQGHTDRAEAEAVWALVKEASPDDAATVRAAVAAVPHLLNVPATPFDMPSWSARLIEHVRSALREFDLAADAHPLIEALSTEPETFLHNSRAFVVRTRSGHWWKSGRREIVWVSLTPRPKMTDQVRIDSGNRLSQFSRDQTNTQHGRGRPQRGFFQVPIPLIAAGVPVTLGAAALDARATQSSQASMTTTDAQASWGEADSYLVDSELTLRVWRDNEPPADAAETSVGSHWFRITKRLALMTPAPGPAHTLDDAAVTLLTPSLSTVQVGDETGGLARKVAELIGDESIAPAASENRQQIYSHWSGGRALKRLLRNIHGPRFLSSRCWFRMPSSAGLRTRLQLVSAEQIGTPAADAWLRKQPTAVSDVGTRTDSRTGLRLQATVSSIYPLSLISAGMTATQSSMIGANSATATSSRAGQELTVPTVLVRTRYRATVMRVTSRDRVRFWHRRGVDPAPVVSELEAVEEVPAGIYRAAIHRVVGPTARREQTAAEAVSAEGTELIERLRVATMPTARRHLPTYMWRDGQLRLGQTTLFGAERIAIRIAERLRLLLDRPENAEFRDFLPAWDTPQTKRMVTRRIMQAMLNEESLTTQAGATRMAADFLSLTAGHIAVRLGLDNGSRSLALIIQLRNARPDVEPQYIGIRNDERTPPPLMVTIPEDSEEVEQPAASVVVQPPQGRTLPSTPHRLQRGVTHTTESVGAINTSIGPNARIRVGRVGFFAAMLRYLRRRQTTVTKTTNETFLDGGDKAQAVYVQDFEVTLGVYALKSPVSRINQLWKRLLGAEPRPVRLIGDVDSQTFSLPVGFSISRDLTFEDKNAALAGVVDLPEPKISTVNLKRRHSRDRTLGDAPTKMVTNWDHLSYVHGTDALVTAVEQAVTQARQLMIQQGASARGTAVGITTPASLSHYLLHQQLTPDRVAALLPTMTRQAVRLHGLGEILNDPAVSGSVYVRAFVETPKIGPQGVLEHAIEHGIAVNHSVNSSWTRGVQGSLSAGPGAHAGSSSGMVQGDSVRRRTAGRAKLRSFSLSTEIERNDTNYHDRGLQVPVQARVRFVVHAVLTNEPVIGSDSFFSASRSVENATAFGLMMSATARRMGVLDAPRPPTSTEPSLFIAQPFNTAPTSSLTLGGGALLSPPRNLGSARLLNVQAVGSEVLTWLRNIHFPQQLNVGDAEPLIGDNKTGLNNADLVLDHTTSEHLEGNWGALIDGGISLLLTYPGRIGRRTVQIVLQVVAQDDGGLPTEPHITQVTAGPRNLELDVTSTAARSLQQVGYTATETVTEVFAGAVEPQRSGSTGMTGTLGRAHQSARVSTVADREMVAVDMPGAWAEVRQRVTLLANAYHRGLPLGAPLRIGHDLVTDKFANHLRTDAKDLGTPRPVSWTRLVSHPAEANLRRWQLGEHSFGNEGTTSLRLPPQFQVADFRGAAAVQAAAMQALIGAGLAGDEAKLGGFLAHQLITSLGQSMLWGTLRTRLSGPLEIPIEDPRLVGGKMTLTLHSRIVRARLVSVQPPHVRDTRGGRNTSSGTSSSESRIDVATFSGAGSGRPGQVDSHAGQADPTSAPTDSYWGAHDHRSSSNRVGAGADAASGLAGSQDAGTGLGGVVDLSLLHSREPSALIEWTEQLVVMASMPRATADTTAALMVTIPDAAPVWMDLVDAAHHLGFADDPRAMERLAAANSAAMSQQQSFIAWRSANLAYERARLAGELNQAAAPDATSTSAPTPTTATSLDDLDAAWVREQQEWHRRKLVTDAKVTELLAEIEKPKSPTSGTESPFSAAVAAVRNDPKSGRSAERLSGWISTNQSAAHPLPNRESDCLMRAMGAFAAFHGRISNQTVDDSVFTDPHLSDLVSALGGTSLTPAYQVDPARLWRAMERNPSAMMLVAVRPTGQPAHVYWLLADDRSGQVQLRWLDTQERGLFDKVATVDDDRYRQLSAPGTDVLVLDASGRPVDLDGFLQDTGVDASTGDLRPSSAEPPSPPLLDNALLPPGVVRDKERSNLYWRGHLPADQTQNEIREAARNVDRQVIYLGVQKRGVEAPGEVIRDVRRLVQQFALSGQQAVVVTEAALNASLKKLSENYRLSIVHLVPKSPANGTGLALNPIWRAYAAPSSAVDLDEGRLKPWFLRRATALDGPVLGSTSTTVGKLLLAPNRDAKLTVVNTLFSDIAELRRRSTTEADAALQRVRDDLRVIVQQVDDDEWFDKFTPLLGEFGASGEAEFVLDYQESTDPVERNRLLIDDRGSNIPVDQRVSLIKQTGHQTAGAATVMEAMRLMLDNDVSKALEYVKARSGSLSIAGKQDWVDAIRSVSAQTSNGNRGADFQRLAAEVLNC
ncbi:hypothetical protein [Micromonospora sp. NPDC049102]|uniref:hypothetical protein n=1 Tax=Micromonospora sp. NPDC049102 TaxID=3364265 RepID=UPI003717B11B